MNQKGKLTLDILEFLNGNPRVSIDDLNEYLILKMHKKVTTAKIFQIINILEQRELIKYVRFNNKKSIIYLKEKLNIKPDGDYKMTEASFKKILYNFTEIYEFESSKYCEGFTIYPIIQKSSLSMLGITEAEKRELGWIQENERAESVEWLEAINLSELPILIPYLHQVEGGKQDRTIFEPIIIPSGRTKDNPLKIPARCIERSRWNYESSHGEATTFKFKSADTRMTPQMGYVASMGADQSTVWNAIEVVADALNLGIDEAPTSSYREIQQKSIEKSQKMSEIFQKLKPDLMIPNQVGLLCFYNDKLLGIEIYGSNSLWLQFNEVVLKGFLTDKVFFHEKISKGFSGDINNILKKEFQDLEVKPLKATGGGSLYKFNDNKWEGICVMFDDFPAHFYASKKHIDILKERKSPRTIPRGYQIRNLIQRQEIINQAPPEVIHPTQKT